MLSWATKGRATDLPVVQSCHDIFSVITTSIRGLQVTETKKERFLMRGHLCRYLIERKQPLEQIHRKSVKLPNSVVLDVKESE